MRTFALDCATPSLGLALLEEERVVGEVYLDLGRHHAEVLLPAADRLFSLAGWAWQAIDLLACTVGPGSFTGVRIGISTVKGLALALQRPVTAVSTLEALAQNGHWSGGWVCPLIDARKSQVYAALYGRDAQGGMVAAVPPCLTDMARWLEGLPDGRILFLGDGALCHQDLICASLGQRALIGHRLDHRVLASAVGRLGLHHFRSGIACDPLALSPFYLQRSAAEIGHEKPEPGEASGSP